MNRLASHDPATEQPVAAAPRTGLMRGAWQRWTQIAHAVGVVQTRFLMIAMYVVFVLPLGLIVGRRQDRLRLKPPEGSLWIPHREQEQTLDSARRQF